MLSIMLSGGVVVCVGAELRHRLLHPWLAEVGVDTSELLEGCGSTGSCPIAARIATDTPPPSSPMSLRFRLPLSPRDPTTVGALPRGSDEVFGDEVQVEGRDEPPCGSDRRPTKIARSTLDERALL